MELQPAFEAVVRLLNDVTFIPFASAFVVTLTSLLKRVLPEERVRASTIALTLQVAVWVIWVVAKEALNVDPQLFENAVAALTTILGAITGFVGSSIGATVVYQAARNKNVPLIGTSRTYYY